MPGSADKGKLDQRIVIDENYISKHSMNKANSAIIPMNSKQAKQLKQELTHASGYSSIDEESKDDFAFVSEEADGMTNDKKLLVQQMRGLFNSVPIKIDEKGYLIQLMHTFEMRQQMADILAEVNQARQLKSYDCMKLIADILRFILTLFVHEQLYDYRLLYSILECSSFIFIISKKRKVYLSSLLYDHGIWSDSANWKEVIEFIIQVKIEDAVKRKKRKEAIDKQGGKEPDAKAFFAKGSKWLKGIV